ncbi:hypothetical protein MNBD_GAMMA23-586 [hydrothermal vent metagenome]|uniref:PilZ domain-containing protein n=1 Tax=hydrothermal vent metagenome TaxID=652676 RepID=A0A3B1ACP2_9ZZZZ
MDERRKHRRKVVNARVRIFHSSFTSWDTQTRDISDGGVLILVDDKTLDLLVNDEVKLIFLDSGNVDVIFNMHVVRLADSGLGLQFLNYEKEGEIYSIKNLREIWESQ